MRMEKVYTLPAAVRSTVKPATLYGKAGDKVIIHSGDFGTVLLMEHVKLTYDGTGKVSGHTRTGKRFPLLKTDLL